MTASASPLVGLLGTASPPPTGPGGLLPESPTEDTGIEYYPHVGDVVPEKLGPYDTVRLRYGPGGRTSSAFSPEAYRAYLAEGIDAAHAVMEKTAPPDPDPSLYSSITGTFDPTAAEIIAALKMSGGSIPPGMDPIAYSKMMSGGPVVAPPPISMPSPSMMSAPTAMPTSSPAATFGAWATPTTALPPTPVATTPLAAPAPMPPVIPKAALPRTATAAPKPPIVRGGGAGPYICDPITGKCPQR